MAAKGIFALFDKEARQQKAFEKTAEKLVSKGHQHEDRVAAMHALLDDGSDRALAALLRRYDMTADKQREDLAEKERLSDELVALGTKVLPALRAHNDRSVNVTLPLQVLRRIGGTEAMIDEILRVLGQEQARLASFKPEKKVTLMRLLADQDDPRVAAAAVRSLSDFDADVRHEAVRLLGKVGDGSAAAPLIDRLLDPAEDTDRVKEAIQEVLAERGWTVEGREAEVAPRLGRRFKLADGAIALR